MSDNFFTFTYDEAEQTKRFYKNLTDEDIKYLEAAVRGDIDLCLSMLEHRFIEKMPKTVVKHKVWRRDRKGDIWEYEIHRKKKSDAGWLGEGVYFYGSEDAAKEAVDYGPFLAPFYINIEHPFQMDRDLHDEIAHRNDPAVSARMTKYLEKNKMDGVLWTGDMREEWCVLSPSQMKRAEVTRDDSGRVIPISLRFDLSKDDNRF